VKNDQKSPNFEHKAQRADFVIKSDRFDWLFFFFQGADGEFLWDTETQSYILSSFFYGYVITQIPFGMLSKKYGSKYFLGVGMLINSLFGLLVPIAAYGGFWPLLLVRFIQGLGEVRSCQNNDSETKSFTFLMKNYSFSGSYRALHSCLISKMDSTERAE